jgi:hypothetical protein
VGKGGFCEAAEQTADDIDKDITKLGELDKVDPSITIDYNFAEETKLDTLQQKLDTLNNTDPVITITTKYVTEGDGGRDSGREDEPEDWWTNTTTANGLSVGDIVILKDNV